MNSPSRRILITGVSRGLGRALVEGFTRLGHTVLGCARSPKAIDELRRNYPPPQRFEVVDVTDAAAVEAWAKSILAAGGPPDLLINNAAIINENAPLWQVPTAQFSQVIDVNIKGVFHVIRSFLPAMVAAGRGVVVNLSSGWGRSTSPEVAPYCASKYAIEGLTLALAQELPSGLAAVPLNPGIIDTEMLRQCFGEDAARHPSAEKWAQTAVPFLLQLGAKDNGKSVTAPC